MEVGLADPPALPPLRRSPEVAVATLDLLATTLGDRPDFLHVHVDHAPGIAGGDRPLPAQVLPVGDDFADPVQAQAVQPAGHGPHAALAPFAVSELAGDPTSRPLHRPPPALDQLHHPSLQVARAVRGGEGAVLKADPAEVAVAPDTLRERGAGDAELRGDVRDQTIPLKHLGDRALPSKRRHDPQHLDRKTTFGSKQGESERDTGCLMLSKSCDQSLRG